MADMDRSFRFVDRYQSSLAGAVANTNDMGEQYRALLELRDQSLERIVDQILNPVRAKVSDSAAQVIATGVLTPLTFATVEYDWWSMFNGTTTLTVPPGGGGTWGVGAKVRWASSAVGLRSLTININGANLCRHNLPAFAGAGGTGVMHSLYEQVVLAEGDAITASVFQSSGGNLAVGAGNPNTPALFCHRIA